MKIKVLITAILLTASLSVWAQAEEETYSGRLYRTYSENGETYGEMSLGEVDIVAQRPSRKAIRKGKKRLKRFTRLRWNVHKVHPYAVKVSNILRETYATLDSLPDDKARKKYLKSSEKSLFGQYEKDIRKMTRSQGKALIKLVDRETGDTMYSLISDMKSGASATFWQSIGSIFGIDLKMEYDPKEDDALIENIVQELESGAYNIVYKTTNYELD